MTTTTPTATAQRDLATVIHHWRDLNEALGAPGKTEWFGTGLRDYLANLDRLDEQQADLHHQRIVTIPLDEDRVTYECVHCDHVGDGHSHTRSEERDPAQLGQRPIPLRVTILDTMQAVHADLLEAADTIAAAVQRQPMGQLPAGYPEKDRQRRALLALKDRADPRRWRWTGTRPTAPYTALWLLGRVQGAPGPFHRLTPLQADDIATVARSCARRVENALDIADRIAPINRPCPVCGGRIEIHGGAGVLPVARCTACGRTWSEASSAA